MTQTYEINLWDNKKVIRKIVQQFESDEKVLDYIKKENVHNCLSSQDIILNRGPVTKWKREWGSQPAGLSGWFTSSNSYIRLAHDPMFDSFGWTTSTKSFRSIL